MARCPGVRVSPLTWRVTLTVAAGAAADRVCAGGGRGSVQPPPSAMAKAAIRVVIPSSRRESWIRASVSLPGARAPPSEAPPSTYPLDRRPPLPHRPGESAPDPCGSIKRTASPGGGLPGRIRPSSAAAWTGWSVTRPCSTVRRSVGSSGRMRQRLVRSNTSSVAPKPRSSARRGLRLAIRGGRVPSRRQHHDDGPPAGSTSGKARPSSLRSVSSGTRPREGSMVRWVLIREA